MATSEESVTSISELRRLLDSERQAGHRVGFVPTMGYLHAGHGSLIEAAAAESEVVVVSIFVNPLQFAPTEDLSAYPRDLSRDLDLIAASSRTATRVIVFTPTVEEMYPTSVLTQVSVSGVSESMEGASRPTHFAGVATVVAKLFAIVGSCRAYFGEKDYQQLAVIRQMALDLSCPVEVVGCPIVRETDGLALSSRNVYLTDSERSAAPVLRRALDEGVRLIGSGVTNADEVRSAVADVIVASPHADLGYVEVADPLTLATVDQISHEVRVFVAARFGRARLIDNCSASPPPNQ